jgi:type IV pilus assembly protein PilC
MLEKTAEHYEQEVHNTVARLSTLLEPFIMVVLGVLIGGLVMALYLPIFQLGQVI